MIRWAYMDDDVTKKIGSIRFSCLSPDEIRKMSMVEVITPDTYDDDNHLIPKGLMDPHMGVIEPGFRCKTCGFKSGECPGHFGHIELAAPVIHVGYIKEIKMLLDSTCHRCGRLMLSEKHIERHRDTISHLGMDVISVNNLRKEVVAEALDHSVCPWCGAKQVKIKLDKPTTFRLDNGRSSVTGYRAVNTKALEGIKLTPREVRRRLEMITDEDLRTLGIDPECCRPEWMVITVLPVPPVTARPTASNDYGGRSEDDLTHKLVDVLRINQRLGENRDAGAPQLIVEDLWELLQYHVTTYFDNQTSGIPPARHRSGRPLKTLAQRLKGKEGRFRSNLSGKRVNFSARTVISPDPLLSINDVGVPIFAARELTIPIHVNTWNIDQVRKIIRRGVINDSLSFPYRPAARYIIRTDGRRIRVTERNAFEVAERVDIGYVVERQLMEGDVVLFNRAPSLHRMSLMAHRVRVVNGSTFRLNPAVCPPYGADFDGDEMVIHVLQSYEARVEARILMQVQENILSPRYGGPIIGGIHDYISGIYFLTHNNPRFDFFQTSDILFRLPERSYTKMKTSPDDRHHGSMTDCGDISIEIPGPAGIDERGLPFWTGRQLFSTILPEDFNATFRARICRRCEEGCSREGCPFDAYVRIQKGVLECGTIDSMGIGNDEGEILGRIAHGYGMSRASRFIDQVTRLSLGALMTFGFSVGISDMDLDEETSNQISASVQDSIESVDWILESHYGGSLRAISDSFMRRTTESAVRKILGDACDNAGKIAEEALGEDNPVVIMAKSGARGSIKNMSQMACCLGQQLVRAQRLSRGYYGRVLPHFERYDLGASARGFCTSSFKSGLSPTEFFFHAMGERADGVDKMIRFSRSGYMQRKLVSAMGDLRLSEDGTVRNSIGEVIQFTYGEDGVDPSRAVSGKAVDIDELFFTVLPEEEFDLLVDPKERKEESGYGSVNLDEMEFTEDEEDLGYTEDNEDEDKFETDGGLTD